MQPLGWLRAVKERVTAVRRIRGVLESANEASPRHAGFLYARAADIARTAGRRDEALKLYGRAIDAYLEGGKGRPAALAELDRPDLAEGVREGRAGAADSTSWSRSVAAAIRHPQDVDVESLVRSG